MLQTWNNHPCVHMWRGYEPALAMYMNYCIREWIDRGYRNTMRFDSIGFDVSDIVFPFWWSGPIHSNHRSILLFKDAEYYGQFEWDEISSTNYLWP